MALAVKGYKALAVPLSTDAAAPFTAFIYVRQHSSKGCVSTWSRSIDRLVYRSCPAFPDIIISTTRAHTNAHSGEEEGLPPGRTLFLANVPLRVGLDTAAYLREAFGR